MPGYTKDENSLATGIPNRSIGPETGSFGAATKTNRADTGEGTNQSHDSVPPPAAGLESPIVETDGLREERSFASGGVGSASVDLPEGEDRPIYERIADGEDHLDHASRLKDDKRLREQVQEELDADRRSRRP